ncbi:MAG TPA: NAD(P)H-binding protein [Humisphaera sp.]|jgi:NADH dehydrogenase|nr:NAD(P)H-binding protein [Humisphaera sp.]
MGRVFVTGASGFVGTAVIRELLARGFDVAALVHRGQAKLNDPRITIVRGDLFSSDLLANGMNGCEAVIHLVGIIREDQGRGATFERIHVEGTRHVVEAATRAKVRRYIHMSAQGARAGAISSYHKTKFAAEEIVRGSTLDWTIFRPSLIHGPGGEFTQMETGWAKGTAMPFIGMPYFGAGILGRGPASKVQPIFVDDVARAFVDALQKPQTIGRTYAIGGIEQITWPQMHRIAAEIIVGKRRMVLAIPQWYALLLTRIVPRRLLPFNRDQVLMSAEDNVVDLSEFISDFGWEPRGFAEALRSYAGTRT